MKVFEKGVGEVSLSTSDFKASGGEGDIYIKGGKAFKIYQDLTKMIPTSKIDELSALNEPYIIKPENILLDKTNKILGYSMRAVPESYALAQYFTKSFKQRNKVEPDATFKLVQTFQRGIDFVHSKNNLIVDVNELNFLLDKALDKVYFIDVDSYQTKSFKATALKPCVRDYHTKGFNINSDWFSFGILSFQMFTGIHPYKGKCDKFSHISDLEENLKQRMIANVSVLNSDVRTPPAMLPTTVIPDAYLDWYKNVLEKGERCKPPVSGIRNIGKVSATSRVKLASTSFNITLIKTFDSDIIKTYAQVTVSKNKIYHQSLVYDVPQAVKNKFEVLITDKYSVPLVIFIDGGFVKIFNLKTNQFLVSQATASDFMVYNNNLYLQSKDKLLLVDLFETASSILVSTKLVANIMPHSSYLFEGVLFQHVLNNCFVSVLDEAGSNKQFNVKELAGHNILDAKFHNKVLITSSVYKGKYFTSIFKIDSNLQYDLRVIEERTDINFLVLDTGVCLYLNEKNQLEMFANKIPQVSIKYLEDKLFDSDVKLHSFGTKAMVTHGNELFQISLS
jgi:hypothetical protein